MSEEKSSYKQIMKATSLFGGVQVFQIVIQILKSKIIAILLGPAGMGIAGLLNTSIEFVTALTSFGLGTSGIKSIAEANGSGNEERIGIIVKILRRCVWITGILGMLVTILFSPWLSQISFGNKDYTIAFIWLAITVILNQLSTGQLVILQGLRKYRYLANANLTGAIFGLIISLPLYYYFKTDGIVPAIVACSIVNLVRSWYFGRKIKVQDVVVTQEISLREAKLMFKLGFVISLSGIVGLASSYLIRIFISNYGNINQVGLYSAAYTLLNTYVGLIFTAMGTDYFPRLSSNASDNNYCKKTVNEQAELTFLLLTPILLVFLVLTPVIIKILFSNEFTIIDKMLYFSIPGMLFRAASWSLSFIFVAKGNAKLFFYNELIASIYILLLNILGYYFAGLTGIGIAFTIGYIIYFIHMSILSMKKYGVFLNHSSLKIFIVQLIITIIVLVFSSLFTNYLRYVLCLPFLMFGIIYSYKILDKKITIKEFVLEIINKIKK